MKPLEGKRVVITRPREKAGDLEERLKVLGAIPVLFPTIAIAPLREPSFLDQALQKLESYCWLVFTSSNAVDAVWERLGILGIDSLPTSLKIATVGRKTADALGEYGVTPHFIPDEFVSEAVVPGLGNLRGRQILIPSADIARDTLPNAIRAAGGVPHVVTAYHTIPTRPNPEGIQAFRNGVDILTFTSGSTARNFKSILQRMDLDPFHLPGAPVVAVIGPKTAREAQGAGFVVDIVAQEYTVEGLIAALSIYFQEKIADESIS